MDGWEDDDDLLLDDTTDNIHINDGWSDDDVDIDIEEEDEENHNNENRVGHENENPSFMDQANPNLNPDSNSNPYISPQAETLIDYVHQLQHKVCPIRYELDTEPLNAYFKSRSNLKTYTLSKEVHRMDYVVIMKDGSELSGADRIRREYCKTEQDLNNRNGGEIGLVNREEMIWRASNQSILADALVVLTPDLIRPEFMATAKATRVSFRLDFSCNKHVSECNAVLAISVPLGDERLELATIEIILIYSIEQLTCEVRRVSVTSGLEQSDLLHRASEQFLGNQILDFEHHVDNLDDRRDALMVQGIQGLEGALRQFNETTGISHKIEAVSSYLRKDLKGCLEEYDREIYQEELGYNISHGYPLPIQDQNIQRPKSLLGGVFGGISKVARLASQQATNNEKTSTIQLYRRDDTNESNHDMIEHNDTNFTLPVTQLNEGAVNDYNKSSRSDDDFGHKPLNSFNSCLESDNFQITTSTTPTQKSVGLKSTMTQDDKASISSEELQLSLRNRWRRPHWRDYKFADEDADFVVLHHPIVTWEDKK